MKPKKMARIKKLAFFMIGEPAKSRNTQITKSGKILMTTGKYQPLDFAAAYAVAIGLSNMLFYGKLNDENFSPLAQVGVAAKEMEISIDTDKAVDMCLEALESIRDDLQGFLAGFGEVAK